MVIEDVPPSASERSRACSRVPTRGPAQDTDWVIAAYHTYFRYVWALLGRLGVPEDAIEDVLQEVFVVLHRRRAEFRSDASVRAWLRGIALQVARRFRQTSYRRQQLIEQLPRPGGPATPEVEVASRRSLEQLDALLSQLGDDQREVFVLAEIAEMTAPEIAGLLGVKLNTVYSRLRLARAALQQALDRLEKAVGGTNGTA